MYQIFINFSLNNLDNVLVLSLKLGHIAIDSKVKKPRSSREKNVTVRSKLVDIMGGWIKKKESIVVAIKKLATRSSSFC